MKRKIIIGSIAAVTVISLFTGYYLYTLTTRNAVTELVGGKKLINILVAGSNENNKGKHSFYAIVSINPENNNIGISFIPPQYAVKLDSSGSKTVQLKDLDFSDWEKIASSIKKDVKLSIPFYIELSSKDVERSIDLIEGVDLFIFDQALKGQKKFQFGLNYLDGKGVMEYINSVEADSIFLKFDRIQDLLLTIYYNKTRYEKFSNLQFISVLFKNMKTNILPQEMIRLAGLVFKEGNLLTSMIPGSFQGDKYIIDDIAYKIYEEDFLTPLVVNKSLDTAIKIKIQNASDSSGLARKMRNQLSREGLNVMEFGTYSQKLDNSAIISRRGNFAAVKRVSEITGIKKIYYIIDNTQLNNILVIIGEDFLK